MKALSFLAILLLGSTAFAGNRHNNCYSGRSSGHYHGGSSVRISVGGPYYGYGGYAGYGGYYRSYPYRSYPYRAYPYYSGYYRPALGFSYVSSSPGYYGGGYSPRYANTDYESSIEADVQRVLKRRGYYRGYVDGDIGPASRSAIRAYQHERGLAVTGRIDSALLRSLGI